MAEHSTVPPSLANLPAHSIFVPPSSSSSSPYSNDDGWELVRDPDDLVYGKRTKKMAFRGNDLLLAVGKEVRMAEMQGHGEVWPVKDGTVGTYQTLKSAHLGFQMNSLVVSEDGRLLAVVGRSQVVIMVLPQLDGSGDENGSVDCK
jgi:nucleoporin NUP82